jgi:hypothetical protein
MVEWSQRLTRWPQAKNPGSFQARPFFLKAPLRKKFLGGDKKKDTFGGLKKNGGFSFFIKNSLKKTNFPTFFFLFGGFLNFSTILNYLNLNGVGVFFCLGFI